DSPLRTHIRERGRGPMTTRNAWPDGEMTELERRLLDAATRDRIPSELKARMAGALAAHAASASAIPASAKSGLLFSKAGLWGWLPVAILAAAGAWYAAR